MPKSGILASLEHESRKFSWRNTKKLNLDLQNQKRDILKSKRNSLCHSKSLF